MVYVDPKNLGYDPYWTRWSAARGNKQEQKELIKLFEKYVTPLIDMILEGVVDGREEKRLKTIVPLTNLNMVRIVIQSYLRYTDTFYVTHASTQL